MNHEKLGRYQLQRLLGQGAMGRVYEAHDPNLDRRVAIKTIHVENLSRDEAAEYERRFRTEGRSIARLQHPHIVSVYDCDRDSDTAYLVMEFVQGIDLKQRLEAGTQYTLAQIARLMSDLLAALEYAHRQNIVHRDIKPANLLIESNGESDGRLKLTDFGIARIEDADDATRTRGSMLGTLKYMSPEQVQGLPTSASSDLYGCGIVLYELLTGVRPFDGNNDFELIQKIVTQEPAPPSFIQPELPPAIDAFLARALAKSPTDRFASAAEMAAALHAAWSTVPAPLLTSVLDRRPSEEIAEAKTQALSRPASELAPTLAPVTLTEPPSATAAKRIPPKKRKKWIVAGLLACVGALALSGYFMLGTEVPAPPQTEPLSAVEEPPVAPLPADTALAVEKPPLAAEPIKPSPAVTLPSASNKPAQAPARTKLCGNRSIFTYGYCMNKECAKPVNAKTPACVRWREESERLNHGRPQS